MPAISIMGKPINVLHFNIKQLNPCLQSCNSTKMSAFQFGCFSEMASLLKGKFTWRIGESSVITEIALQITAGFSKAATQQNRCIYSFDDLLKTVSRAKHAIETGHSKTSLKSAFCFQM